MTASAGDSRPIRTNLSRPSLSPSIPYICPYVVSAFPSRFPCIVFSSFPFPFPYHIFISTIFLSTRNISTLSFPFFFFLSIIFPFASCPLLLFFILSFPFSFSHFPQHYKYFFPSLTLSFFFVNHFFPYFLLLLCVAVLVFLYLPTPFFSLPLSICIPSLFLFLCILTQP